jgi:hypothetical protein
MANCFYQTKLLFGKIFLTDLQMDKRDASRARGRRFGANITWTPPTPAKPSRLVDFTPAQLRQFIEIKAMLEERRRMSGAQ